MIDSTTLEFLIDDLFLHSRQNSTDSGLDDGTNLLSLLSNNYHSSVSLSLSAGRCTTNPSNDGTNSNEFFDTLLFPDPSNAYNTFPLIDQTQSKVNRPLLLFIIACVLD